MSWAAALGQSVTITYAFRSSVTAAETAQWPAGVSGFSQFNATQIAVTEEMLHLWAEATNITFVRVGSGTSGVGAYSNSTQILFGNFTSGPAAFSAFTYLPPLMGSAAADVDGNVWVNVSRDYDANPVVFPLGAHILAHEIGHALGLDHPGDYNGGANGGATYTNDADFWQDTAMFSNMSYFNASFTGGDYGASYALAPQMLDIAAIQRLYGVNTSTRAGDTTYGFNANTGHAVFSIGRAAQTAIFCVWDCGGDDTLNLSGYSTNSDIDLRPESFSSAGPDGAGGNALYNNSIARGVTIENAIGGSGADTITGNDVNNQLTGNAGNDVLNGGLGFDTANYASASTSDSWHRNPDGSWTIVAGSEGTDTLTSVERAHFTGRDLYLDPAQQTFSGDGMSDILWRRNDGLGAIWEMNSNSATLATGVIGGVGTSWHVAGIGDFNSDGKDDLLWKSNAGQYAIWDMNGFAASTKSVIGSVGAEWSVQAVADFNGDGSDEILWRRTDGLVALWNTNGIAQTGSAIVGSVGADWGIVGTGDFNDDGRADILWQRSDGLTAIWEMNGASQIASAVIGGVGTSWHVAGVGDYNGDGSDDIFWRNDSGLLAVWTMNGSPSPPPASPAASVMSGELFDDERRRACPTVASARLTSAPRSGTNAAEGGVRGRGGRHYR